MKIRILLSLFILGLVIGCEEEEDFVFRFEGTVTNEYGTPIDDASITLNFNNILWTYGPLETRRTNSEGRYIMAHSVGNWYKNDACVNNIWVSHSLKASKTGYGSARKDSLKCTEEVQVINFIL